MNPQDILIPIITAATPLITAYIIIKLPLPQMEPEEYYYKEEEEEYTNTTTPEDYQI